MAPCLLLVLLAINESLFIRVPAVPLIRQRMADCRLLILVGQSPGIAALLKQPEFLVDIPFGNKTIVHMFLRFLAHGIHLLCIVVIVQTAVYKFTRLPPDESAGSATSVRMASRRLAVSFLDRYVQVHFAFALRVQSGIVHAEFQARFIIGFVSALRQP